MLKVEVYVTPECLNRVVQALTPYSRAESRRIAWHTTQTTWQVCREGTPEDEYAEEYCVVLRCADSDFEDLRNLLNTQYPDAEIYATELKEGL